MIQIERDSGKRDALLDKASPPICFRYIWDYYWAIRRGERLLCSEILAYKQLTNADIGGYETDLLLLIDDYVSNRVEHNRELYK